MRKITEKIGNPPPVVLFVKKLPDLAELSLIITVVTPMAGGGVEAGTIDLRRPVRIPSIRGHLRYWWRMMNRGSDDLSKREAEIWGSTENPSKVYVDVPEQPSVGLRLCENDYGFSRFGSESYALFPFKQNKQDVSEKFSFTLRLQYPKEFTDDVYLAISAWIYFGGLGSRTRRGCGSLSCSDTPLSLKQVLSRAEHITLWRKKANGNDPLQAWHYVLNRYKSYRQCRNRGQDPRRPGRSKWPEADSLREITGDSPLRHSKPITSPRPSFPRAALGMPIIFHFAPKDSREEPDGIEILPIVDDKKANRMASPVITKALCDNGTWYSAVIILPHDRVFGIELSLSTDHGELYPLKSEEYRKVEPMQGKCDAISGFEEYISGDFRKEA